MLIIGSLLFAGVVAYSVVKAQQPSQPPILPETIDLNSVRDAIIEKQGWSMQRAEAARTEYVRFLTLLQMKPGFMLVPWLNAEGKDDLDQFWHQHILDTKKYAEDCDLLFGRIIHHNPHVVRGSGEEKSSVVKTQRLYARTFGARTDGSAVDTPYVAGCAACATVDISGHDGGGHDGGHGCGGDGGGHGCGGHGCGGHGCGGCGGH